MTREELARKLAALKQARDDRIETWDRVVEADGTPAERIYSGLIQRPRDTKSGA